MAKLTYSNIMEVSLDSLGKAVTDWQTMVAQLERLAKDAYSGMLQKSDAARWAGVNAEVTKDFVRKTAKEFQDAHIEAKSLWTVLDAAYTDFTEMKSNIKEAVRIARTKNIFVHEAADGTAKCDWAECRTQAPGKEDEQWKQEQEDYINQMISQMEEIDAGVTRALGKTHGKDKHNFGHATYRSLDDVRAEQTGKEDAVQTYGQSAKWGSGTVKPVAEFLSYRSWMNSANSALHGEGGKAYDYFLGGAPSFVGGEVSKGLENSGGGGRHRKPTVVNGIGRFGGKIFGWPVALVATAVDFTYTPPGVKEPGDTRVVAPGEPPNRVEYGGGNRSSGTRQPLM
ncbi:hypothetical protein [Streptomyces sp. NPDC048636]|uniref:hypothetical protein n=1 Tax=Streptomyces sp. NPDC048636 TaxID=3155762 RepID=UPI003425820B